MQILYHLRFEILNNLNATSRLNEVFCPIFFPNVSLR